jgi:hypothetical protein
MTRTEIEEQIVSLEKERDQAMAVFHRTNGAIEMCRHFLSKLDKPPEPEPEKPA